MNGASYKRKVESKKYWRAFMLLGLLAGLVACESDPTAAPTTQPINTPTNSSPLGDIPTNTPTTQPANTPTPPPTFTSTPQPPTPTPTLTPTPTPSLKRLTSGGCCVQPFWVPDSKQVLFIDKPDEKTATGIYAVDIVQPATPKLFSERIASFTNDFQYATYIEGAFAVVEQMSDGQRWRIRTGGRPVLLSPDRTQVIWNETPQTGAPNDTLVTTVMGANRDGSDARPIIYLQRGGSIAWLGNTRLLMNARFKWNSEELTLFVFSLEDGSQTELAKSERLRGFTISLDGAWVAYQIAFDTKTPQDNGLWLVKTDGSSAPKKLDFFGPVQWRDVNRFIYVPLETNVASHAFYEYDTRTNISRRLTDPKATPFKIANGDWTVSPDGNKIVFLNAQDLNLWLWEFRN